MLKSSTINIYNNVADEDEIKRKKIKHYNVRCINMCEEIPEKNISTCMV